MKKLWIFLMVVLILAFVPVAISEQLSLPNVPGRASIPPEATNTLLNAVTSTGDGTPVDLGFTVSRFTVTIVWGGLIPTSTITTLKGSIDNITFATLVTQTSTASGDMYHVVNKPVRYILGGYTSKVGGDGTTSVTMKCTAGGIQ